jgi:outer membrane usher protein
VRPALIAAAGLSLFIAPLAAAVQDPRTPSAAPAVCQLVLNERRAGDLTVFVLSDDVWIATADLEKLGLTWQFPSSRTPTRGYVSLNSLAPHISGTFNDRDVTLTLTASAGAFTNVTSAGQAPATVTRTRPFSAFLNYATTVRTGGRPAVTGELGMTVLGRFFVRTVVSGHPDRLLRRESSVTFDDEQHLVRWTAGDDYVDSPWAGRQRGFAGISVARNFRINPVFVTAGPLSFRGATAVPATAEVYVNGHLVRRATIDPGAFELRDIAPTIGAGDVRLVIRDEFGRATETRSSYYRSPHVLRPGLHEFRYAVGFLRGLQLRGAETLIASAEHRTGLGRFLTAGGAVEATKRGVNGGTSLALQLPFGEFELSGWASRVDRAQGHAWSAAYGYRGRAFDVQAVARWSSDAFAEADGFRETTSATGNAGRVLLTTEGSVGLTLPRGIRIATSHRAVSGGDRRQEGTLFITKTIRGVGVSAGGLWQEQAGRRGWTGLGSLTVPLGSQRSASTDAVAAPGASPVMTVGLQQSLPAGSGVGYRLKWQDATSSVSAAIETQHPYGRAGVYHDTWENGELTTATAAGGITFIAGSWHLTRPVDDAFALVRVRGVRGVRTYASNQLVGRTDRRGELLLPALASFLPTRVAIDDRDVPFSLEIGATESHVSPPFRGGSLVTFHVNEIRRVSGRFLVPLLPSAEIVALADWNGRQESVSVAHDGRFEFEHALPGRYVVRVGGRGHWYSCTITVAPPASDVLGVQQMGEVPCRALVLPIARLR